LFLEKT